MRKDIAETLREFLMNGIKPNYSKIAKQFNCDARTVKRYFLNCQNLKRKPRVVVKVLDAYEELVIEKLELGANAYSIFNFIKKIHNIIGNITARNIYIRCIGCLLIWFWLCLVELISSRRC